jgi:phage terminase small subunit
VGIHAPSHLSPRCKTLYRELAADYHLADEPHALETLRLALESLDRAEQARAQIAKDGAYPTDRWGQVKAHPALAVERDSTIRVARLFRELSLDAELGEPRIPRTNGARS